ncbi:MAG: TrbG/VirB9 family P-type conjugative transfer protein [Caulobacteraceae bacterium]|nr:TrbG/VirB9 family P-type conjugative transfer protein [Caulobacter sp.]
MRAAFLALALLAAAPAAAAPSPYMRIDPRIRVIPYDSDAVIRLDALFGFQTMVQFGPDEQIQNVSIGDGAAWQVTPNKAATLLFIKPLDIAAVTNMTVVTDKRSYLFELTAHASGAQPPYVIRFAYPKPPPTAAETAPPVPPPPEARNTDYAYTGSRANLPSVVFDDGRFTYFQWPVQASTPALFVVGPDGQETLANYSMRGGYQVVEQVAPRFVLRAGKEVTTVINEAWREPDVSPSAPRPADAKTARAAARAEGRR